MISSAGKALTEREKATLEMNLDAFRANFFDPVLYKMNDGKILIFPDQKSMEEDFTGSYIQFCYNADYASGFLYGAVVERNRRFENWINRRRPE